MKHLNLLHLVVLYTFPGMSIVYIFLIIKKRLLAFTLSLRLSHPKPKFMLYVVKSTCFLENILLGTLWLDQASF